MTLNWQRESAKDDATPLVSHPYELPQNPPKLEDSTGLLLTLREAAMLTNAMKARITHHGPVNRS